MRCRQVPVGICLRLKRADCRSPQALKDKQRRSICMEMQFIIHYRLAQAVHSVGTPVIISSSADRASVFWKGQNSSDQWSFTSARNAEAPTMTSDIDLLRCITSVTRCGYKGESPRQASRYYHRFEWGPLLRLEVAFGPRIHDRWIHPVVGNRQLI